ncbi:MAG: hypothetical protein ABGZ53_20130 [Fuerstiella sp.]
MIKFRWIVVTITLLFLLLVIGPAAAQPPSERTMDRHAWRWHSPGQSGATATFQIPVGYSYLPYGGHYGYGSYYGVSPFYAYSAYGSTSTFWQRAPSPVEQTREQYLKNQALYLDMRREQRKAIDARKAKQDDKRWERRARNLARAGRPPSALYPRLGADQLDVTTGKISWPQSLLGIEFGKGRRTIEAALSEIAENGPDQQTALEIRATADQMKTGTNSLMSELGFTRYTETRKFLCSLSAAGYYALEDL